MKRLLFLAALALSSCNQKHDDRLPPDQFSCVDGGYVKDCLNEVKRMKEHPIPDNLYTSAGNFILLNATCVGAKAEFAFHSVYRIYPFLSKIQIDITDNYETPDKDEYVNQKIFYKKIGAIISSSYSGNIVYKNILREQYPALVQYLENVGAFDHTHRYFLLKSKEMRDLTNLPLCKVSG